MIGIIDPALLLPRADEMIIEELALVTIACRKHAISIIEFEDYWKPLWSQLGRQLEQQRGQEVKSALRELRKLGVRDACSAFQDAAKIWKRGFSQLFESNELGPDWVNRMAAVTAGALAQNDKVIIFTRRIEGRNLRTHKASHVLLHENTRWVLHVSLKRLGPKQVLCVYHPRNLLEQWTSRFDWRLPSENDGGEIPFRPPDQWWKGSIEAFRTMRSKPCWRDRSSNGWARPNIPDGAGEHWDLFLEDRSLREKFNLDQLNIVQYPPCADKKPGDIHHVPSQKAGRLAR